MHFPTDRFNRAVFFPVLRKKSIGVIFYLKFSVSIFGINYSSVWKMVLNILSFFYLDILDDVFVCAEFFAKIKNKCFMTGVPQH